MRHTQIIALAAGFSYASAQTSLFLMGFDEQPISADILGVADGRTTWALHHASPTGTEEDADGFGGQTATLVEGPNDASLTLSNFGYACSFTGTQAVCSAADGTAVATETVPIERVEVQAGTTAAGINTVAPASNTRSTTGVSSPTPTATGTGSATATAPTTTPSNAALQSVLSGTSMLLALAAAVFALI